MSGWICLHRSLLDWEWYDDVNTTRLFIHCLLRANHKPRSWRSKEIGRGQLWTSLDTLADETGLSVKQIRTALNKLIVTGEVASSGQARGRMVTVLKYDNYQREGKLEGKLGAGSQNKGPEDAEGPAVTGLESDKGAQDPEKEGQKEGKLESEKGASSGQARGPAVTGLQSIGPNQMASSGQAEGQTKGKLGATNNNDNNGNNIKHTSCPHGEIIDLYHKHLPSLKGVIVSRWTGSARSVALKARWTEDAQHQDLAFWENFFIGVSQSEFHMGSGGRGWRADLGWLVVRKNFDNILETIINQGR